jgi:hypothetical protein
MCLVHLPEELFLYLGRYRIALPTARKTYNLMITEET